MVRRLNRQVGKWLEVTASPAFIAIAEAAVRCMRRKVDTLTALEAEVVAIRAVLVALPVSSF